LKPKIFFSISVIGTYRYFFRFWFRFRTSVFIYFFGFVFGFGYRFLFFPISIRPSMEPLRGPVYYSKRSSASPSHAILRLIRSAPQFNVIMSFSEFKEYTNCTRVMYNNEPDEWDVHAVNQDIEFKLISKKMDFREKCEWVFVYHIIL